jgi:hypothetical protein
MRKIPRRASAILGVSAAVALAVNGGVAWAYWNLSGRGSASAAGGTAVELQVSAVPQPDSPIYPGATTDIYVTVTNPNTFAIRVHAFKPGLGPVMADAAHASAGCVHTGVSIVNRTYGVSWYVAKKTSRVFGLPDGIRMTSDSDSACQGASFTVPIAVIGTSES